MKTNITYACGHEGTVQLYGKSADRERKKAWMEKNAVCPACQTAEREKKARKAIQETADLSLPALTGSPKQIEWASGIRAEKVQEARKYLDPGLPKEFQEKARKFYDWYISQTEAAWWIDHRNDSLRSTVKATRKYWD